MYPVDAGVQSVKIFPVHKILLTGPGAYIYFSIYSNLFSLKPFKFTYMEMKIFENTFPPYEDLQVIGMLFIPISPLTPPLVMSNA